MPTEPRVSAPPPNLARIPGGEFLMGSADADMDERPVHRVHVSEFYIGRFPVTQDEYARFINATGYPAPTIVRLPLITSNGNDQLFKERAMPYCWDRGGPPAGHGSHPVVLVRYEDAMSYCGWLSSVLRRPARLPTEAEWEKAARGGVDGQRYPWGEEADTTRGNFLTGSPAQRGTRAAGTYAPNGFGLYDMAGNVWEWVSDWYAPDYYGAGEARDPRGPETGEMRIVRGGSWVTEDPAMLRTACRHKVPPDTYAYSVGFRIVCSA